MQSTVIFDLDGTLADTSGDLLAAANRCFEDMGFGSVLEPLRDAPTALRGGRAMLRKGLERVDSLSEARIEQYYPVLLEAYESAISVHTKLFEGVRETVDALLKEGYQIGICTNKPAGLAEKLMAELNFRTPFACLIGADTLPVRKPDPEPLFEAIRRVGGQPESACLVGDSITDHKTARAAGVPSILVDFGLADQDLSALEPEALLTDFRALRPTLHALSLRPQ